MSAIPNDLAEKAKWIALATGSALIAGFAARNLIKASWHVFTEDGPPLHPASRDTDWAEAITWTVATGVAAGLARLVARRGATTVWEEVKGTRPPSFS